MLTSKYIKKAQPLFASWRAGLARCTGATALVALLNIIFLCVAAPSLKPFNREHVWDESTAFGGAIYEGSCERAKQLSVWLHLAINILSTVLLASGNYTQQILTAPTRVEIDRAHEKRSWLDIGILSYRNLRGIGKGRVVAWGILATTSIPIHLLYNSVVSFETSANHYTIDAIRTNETSIVPDYFDRLEVDECISRYSGQFIPNRSDLYLVVPPDFGHTLSTADSPQQVNPGSWMCLGMKEPCTIASLKARPEDWSVYDWSYSDANGSVIVRPVPIKYCLSKPTKESCRLAMSIPLMAIVVGCNVLKLVGLGLTWLFLDKQPLLTLGDAVASFLEYPDPTTASSSLLCIGPRHRSVDWSSVFGPWKSRRRQWAYFISPFMYAISVVCYLPGAVFLCMGPAQSGRWNMAPKQWKARRRLWAYFISPSIYVISMFSSVAAIATASYFLKEGIDQIARQEPTNLVDLWNRGFGSVDVGCLVYLPGSSPIETTLLSNTPQLIVSIIYTTVNGMWTAMMAGNEWNGYGLRQKGLRTTSPIGEQRNSYWLSLPWRYGLPLVAASTLLHWLISQSIFFVRIIVLEGEKVGSLITQPGYSPIGIIFSIICGASIMIATVGLSLIPCKTAVPQVGTCSAVLSAACHPPEGDEDAALKKVKWGVVAGLDATEPNEKERCCVTSWTVKSPVEGKWY